MSRKVFKLLLLIIYFFASSTIFHVWAMAHDMMHAVISDEHMHPCEHGSADFNTHKSSKSNWDCYESCFGIYSDLGWAATIIIHDIDTLPCDYSSLLITSSTTVLRKNIYAKSDPPPPTLIWYGCIGKNVKKLE